MLKPQWTGRRVTVRRVLERAPDGRLLQGDVVGDLVELDAVTAVVETGGGLVEVPVALVTAARLVEPSTRDVLELQAIVARGLRSAHTRELDGWLLRADEGSPRRANSVLPRGQLRTPIDGVLDEAKQWYSERGSATLVRVAYPARRLLDAALAEREWSFEASAELLVAGGDRLTAFAGDPTDGGPGNVILAATPDAAWLDLAGSSPADAALLARHDTVRFASLRSPAGAVLAVARGCVDDAWLGIDTVVVDPGARRRGLAGRLIAALAASAVDHGARRVYLQVEVDNTAARALYAKLGFALHHAYHYRREP